MPISKAALAEFEAEAETHRKAREELAVQIHDLLKKDKTHEKWLEHYTGLIGIHQPQPVKPAIPYGYSPIKKIILEGGTFGEAIEAALKVEGKPVMPKVVTTILIDSGMTATGKTDMATLVAGEMARLARAGRLSKNEEGYFINDLA